MSLNKLGDRRYLQRDLCSAKQYYKEALRIRQESCKGTEPVSAEVQLGIATSLLKLVDIEQVGPYSLRCMCPACCMAASIFMSSPEKAVWAA